MFQSRWQLFRVAGIAIAIDASWLIVFALLSWTFAREFGTLASVPPAHAWAMGVVTCLAFFGCILLHELGHALVARREGIPLRGITLFLFGGVAEMEGDVPSARKEFWMAVAGPAVTGVLILIFWGLRHLGAEAGWPVQVLAPLQYLTVINLVVLVFNLIPAFPLDGGRVFRAALWAYTGSLRRATYWASWTGRAFAWLLIALGVLSMIGGDFVGGLWSILIGLFLHNAAAGSYRLVLVRQVLQGTPVARFMNPDPITVPPEVDLRRWVEEYVYRYHYKAYPVVADGHLVGMVGTRGLDRIPRAEWDRHAVAEIMRPDAAALAVTLQTDAYEALEKMQRTSVSRLPVVDDLGQLVGIVSLKDLLRYLRLKLELEGAAELDEGPRPATGPGALPAQAQRPTGSRAA